ncbi:VWA domain-containing protein [bacterium]|nr:VWA domain-containing protein [bacterium]
MHNSSQRSMRQARFRKGSFLVFIIASMGLAFMPTIASAMPKLLKVQVDTIWIDESTTVHNVTASFPYYVLSRIKVYDEEGHYVPKLAARDRWLKLNDMTDNGQYVSEAWRNAVEYHVENKSIPENPNLKSNSDYFGVTEVRMCDYSLSVMLVMDYSRSMDDVGILEEATLDLIRETGGRDPFGIIKFSNEVKICQTLTQDTLLLKAAITDSTVERIGTSLYCSIDTAINHLQYRAGRRVVVVYTDGKNDHNMYNQTTLEEVIQHANEKNVELFVIGLGGGIDKDVLLQLARETGGKYFYGETSRRLDPIFLKIYGDLRGYYIMRHLSPDPFHNGTWRWVEVNVVDVWREGTGRGKYFVPYYATDVHVSKSAITDSVVYSLGGQTWYSMASDTVTYTIQLENKGKGAYPEIQIVDMLDDSLSALSAGMMLDDNITLDNINEHQISWTVPRLDAATTLQIQYQAKLDPVMPVQPIVLKNHVQLYGDSAFTVQEDRATVNGFGQPDFSIDCISPDFIASPSQRVSLQAQVLNQGNAHNRQPFRISFEYQGQIMDYDTLQMLDIGMTTIAKGTVSFPDLGNYKILVRADADLAIQELDETNNADICTLNVQITDLGIQISDVNFRDAIRGIKAKYPEDLLTAVNVYDQNVYPVPGLSSNEVWNRLEDNAPAGVTVGNIWNSFHETYRDNPDYPSDSDIRPGMQVTELTNSSASWALLVSTGGVPSGWLEMIKPALFSFTGRLQSGDRVCLMAGHESVSTLQSFTNSGNLIKQGIQDLTNAGGQRLWDNLMAAVDMAAGRSRRNGVMAVVGGDDQGSSATMDDLVMHAQELGVPLYIMGLKNETDASVLRSAAMASGGYFWSFEDVGSLRDRVEDAERLLRNYYLLHHASSDTLKNLSWRQLDLDVHAYEFSATDIGIYRSPKGIYDVSVNKSVYSETYQIEDSDTVWTVQPGDSAWFTVHIANEGDFIMFDISVEDSLPDNFHPKSVPYATFTTNPKRLTWTIDTLFVGEEVRFDYCCFVDTLSRLIEENLGTWIELSIPGDEMTSNNMDRDTLRYIPLLAADVSIQKKAIGDSSSMTNGDTTWYVYPQGTVVYHLTIQNHGEMPAKSIQVKDVLPHYLDWLNATRPLSEIRNDTLIWEIPRLNGHNASLSWYYTCYVDSLMPPWDVPLVNSASVFSPDDAVSENNAVVDTVIAVGIAPPYPNIVAAPTLIYPHDSVAVAVITPFTVASWDLKVIYGDETVSDTYADPFIAATSLNLNEKIEIQPDFTDTRQRTVNAEETVRIIFQTTDIWGVIRNDTASVVITLPDVVVQKLVQSDSLRFVNGDTLWYADPGEIVYYTVILTNQGKLPCYDLEIRDIMAHDLSLLEFNDQAAYTYQGDTLSWHLNSLNGFNDQVKYCYSCRLNSVMPPWIEEEINSVSVVCDRDRNLNNNADEVILYAVGDIPPDPYVFVIPSQNEPGDSVQVYVMSPIEIEPGQWSLSIEFEDGSVITDYAENFIINQKLNPGDTVLVRPAFNDTRMRSDNREENFQVVLETVDDWQASYFDTASVTLRSGDAVWLDHNVFRFSRDQTLGIRFRLSSNRHAKIAIYDLAGAWVDTIVDGPCLAGWNQAVWDGNNRFHHRVGSGVYMLVYRSGNVKKAHKFIVVR